MADVKQVIVMRKDLNMRKGKAIAQGAHASSAFLIAKLNQADIDSDLGSFTDTEYTWYCSGMTKICVTVDSEEELLALFSAAVLSGLTCHMITDAGRTEFHGVPTKTCLAIGPDEAKLIDPLTSHLKLY